MRSVRRRFTLAVIVATIATNVAWSQPDRSPTRQKALDLFARSDVAYKAGKFEDAARLLREAHAIHPEPILLYNLARALEGMGDLRGAIDNYKQFLDVSPTFVDDRGAIERRIATLEAQLSTEKPHRIPTGPTSPPIDSTQLDVQRGPRVLPWVIAGAGVAVIATGGVFGYLSGSRRDDAVAEPVQAEAVRLEDQARTFAATANILFVTGAVVTAGGAIWIVLDRRRARPANVTTGARVQIAPAYVGVEWTLP
jgi:tetratricopeptide (TPR) repeat protein